MLYKLETKEDVLAMLYAIGQGYSLPAEAVPHLEQFITFHLQDEPSSYSSFHLENAETGEVLKSEMTPNYRFTMFQNGDRGYKPELKDFEPKFELPAAAFAHFESGFDRSGSFAVAFIDIQPLAKLVRPARFDVRSELISVFNILSASDLTQMGIENAKEVQAELASWLDEASEMDVRKKLTEHFGRSLMTDQELEGIMTKGNKAFALCFSFLLSEDWAKCEERMDRKSPPVSLHVNLP